MEYAKLRMSMRLGNARYSAYHADPGAGRRSGLRVGVDRPSRFSTAPDGHLRDQVPAHIEGGAARLAEARVRSCSVRRKLARRLALRGVGGLCPIRARPGHL